MNKKNIHVMIAAAAATLLAGCFTVHHCEYPQVQASRAPEGAVAPTVQLSGFGATVTKYIPVVEYGTAWRERPIYRHGRYRGGYWRPETYSTTTYVPQTCETTIFVERASDILEDAGFQLAVTNADYTVDVQFSGPFVSDGDRTAEIMWILCSALSADYSAQTWHARLRIHDARTGRLAMKNDYAEKYTAAVWGPLPILSPAGSDQTDCNTMQSWCLSALTDRTMADATAFLASVSKPAAGNAAPAEEPAAR